MSNSEKTGKVESIASDGRVKRAIEGLAREIENPGSYDAADKLTVLIDSIEKRAAVAIDARISQTTKNWAWRIGGVGGGFALALTLFGLNTNDMLRERIKSIYPPDAIYSEVKDEAMKSVHVALTDKNYTTEDQLVAVADEIRKRNTESLIRSFESPAIVSRSDIEEVAPLRPVEVKVSSLLNEHYGKPTSCGLVPHKSQPQAVLLRPALSPEEAYFPPWMRCEPKYPQIQLALSPDTGNTARSRTLYVELIGVHGRNPVAHGCNKKPTPWQCSFGEIQLTQAALKDWEKLNGGSRSKAWIRVSDVDVPRPNQGH